MLYTISKKNLLQATAKVVATIKSKVVTTICIKILLFLHCPIYCF